VPRVSLPVLDAQVAARCAATVEAHPDWPCGEGCDLCCRSLPHLPTITRAEWDRLAVAIAALPASVRTEVRARTEAAEAPRSHGAKVVCPLLDRERGACLVYDARPIACRTYGFYAERDAGLHCERVTAALAAPHRGDVVWGNGEAIASALREHGEPVSIGVWMRETD
jgi:Fe-S-cluster containining protein